MPVSIGGSENPGNRICAIFLPPQYSCELYDSGLERYRTLKKQSKKTRMLQSMHSQLFVVLLYPPAGSGCCRISCRYSFVLRKMTVRYRAPWQRDMVRKVTVEAAMAKMTATETAQQVIDAAVQIFGGQGVVSGEPVERLYREIRPLRIYEGTTEVQQLIIARGIIKSFAEGQVRFAPRPSSSPMDCP